MSRRAAPGARSRSADPRRGADRRAVRAQCRDPSRQQPAGRIAIRLPGRKATARCGCRSTPNSRSRITSVCRTPRNAPTGRRSRPQARRSRRASVRRRATSARNTWRRRTDRFRAAVLADRRALCRDCAAPGLVETPCSASGGSWSRPDHIAGAAQQPAHGVSQLGDPKRSSEVWQVLRAVKTEFARYGEVLDKVQKKLHEPRTRSKRLPSAGGRSTAGSRRRNAARGRDEPLLRLDGAAEVPALDA